MLIDFFKFSVNPKSLTKSENKIIKKVLAIGVFFIFIGLLNIIFNVIAHYWVNSSSTEFNTQSKLFSLTDQGLSIEFTYTFALFTIFLEELKFRLPLIINNFNLSLAIGLLLSFQLSKLIFPYFKLTDVEYLNYLLVYNGLPLLIGFAFFSLLYWVILPGLEPHVKNFLNKQFNFFTYLLIILFALSHLDAFEFSSYQHYIFLIPYFYIGLVLSFLRIRFGFTTALFFHILIFSIPFLYSNI